jgi:diphthine-ammonia ligase
MRLVALFSGGKDSTYAILRAKEMGHEVVCLLTMHPNADDSQLFHYPNSRLTRNLAESMKIPLIEYTVNGSTKGDETDALEQALRLAQVRYTIDGVVHGGISSNFQKQVFESACGRAALSPVAPLWNADPEGYMHELIHRGFEIMIVGVSAMGLGAEWLGRILNDKYLEKLSLLSKKNGFNLNFEGGEAETLVVDCPLYAKRLAVKKAEIRWDGQRGIFEIREAALVEK